MLTTARGKPITSERIRQLRGIHAHPSAKDSGIPCAARREKYDNFVGSQPRGACAYCGCPRALHR